LDNRFLHENVAHDLTFVVSQPIAILGCGAIGSNLAQCLGRMGFSSLHLLDKGRIKVSDIGTQVWFTEDIGQFKAPVLSRIIQRINPINKAVPYVVDAQVVNNLYPCISKSNLVVDCFDNQEARELTIKCHTNVVHIAFLLDGSSEVQWDTGYTLPADLPIGYPLSRSLIEITVGQAAHIITRFFLEDTKENHNFAIK
jgi:tRNA A37 threonylcarbamoyladenosine dehydratase